MNIRVLLVTMFAVALSSAPQLVSASSVPGTYSAQLISPRAGQVLYPGQQFQGGVDCLTSREYGGM
jgi:hypothetical protein